MARDPRLDAEGQTYLTNVMTLGKATDLPIVLSAYELAKLIGVIYTVARLMWVQRHGYTLKKRQVQRWPYLSNDTFPNLCDAYLNMTVNYFSLEQNGLTQEIFRFISDEKLPTQLFAVKTRIWMWTKQTDRQGKNPRHALPGRCQRKG